MQGHSECRGQLSSEGTWGSGPGGQDLGVRTWGSGPHTLSSDDGVSGRGGRGAGGRWGTPASFCVRSILKVVEPAGFFNM